MWLILSPQPAYLCPADFPLKSQCHPSSTPCPKPVFSTLCPAPLGATCPGPPVMAHVPLELCTPAPRAASRPYFSSLPWARSTLAVFLAPPSYTLHTGCSQAQTQPSMA